MTQTLAHPKRIRVNRTELRKRQRETLKQAKGSTIVVISASDQEDEKLLVDRSYFDDLVQKLSSLIETLDITTDRKLFPQILRAASTLEEDTRRGRLHSFKEVFGED
ncbi:MAG: hypothetical protein WB780_16565 [Candidatus Acidiferrales bacterium]